MVYGDGFWCFEGVVGITINIWPRELTTGGVGCQGLARCGYALGAVGDSEDSDLTEEMEKSGGYPLVN